MKYIIYVGISLIVVACGILAVEFGRQKLVQERVIGECTISIMNMAYSPVDMSERACECAVNGISSMCMDSKQCYRDFLTFKKSCFNEVVENYKKLIEQARKDSLTQNEKQKGK